MRRNGLALGAGMIGLLAVGGTISRAADAIKLRPVAPIYADNTGAPIKHPEGVACGGKDLVVADSGNGRILTYTLANGTVTAAGVFAVSQVPYPIRVQLTGKGEILAFDGKLRKIARLSLAGEFKGFVEIGAGDPALGTVVPKSFKVAGDGTIYVLDLFGARVLVLSSDGKLTRQIAFPTEYGFITDLAVNSAGTVYLIDSVGRKVFSASKDATTATALTESMTEDMDLPTAIAVDGKGRIYLLDHDGGGVVVLGPDGSFRGRQLGLGWKEGYLRYPADLCLDDRGDLFVADRANNRVQVFVSAQ